MPTAPLRHGPLRQALVVTFALVLALTACSSGDDSARGDRPSRDRGGPDTAAPVTPRRATRGDALPVIVPTPSQMAWVGPDVTVPGRADVVAGPDVDQPTRTLLTEVLEGAGAEVTVPEDAQAGDEADEDGGLVVRAATPDDPDVAAALSDAGVTAPPDMPAEGYVLAAVGYDGGAPAQVVIAAKDPAGWFYGAQTLRQITVGDAIAGVSVVDRPAMPIRGTIEGFYGSPWTHEERLDQLAFYGRVKLNAYVYAPKDDPYHRDRWREPYPGADLDRLRQLVDAARANHVRFTFAVSPGPSICYSNPADTDALIAKLQAMYDIGVRAFAVAFDDISADRWNCDGDLAYGQPSMGAAAKAQATVLGQVRERFVEPHDDVDRLQMVPTDYRGITDSDYRQALRQYLDRDIQVMWTGRYVVPAGITVAEAEAAAGTYGRPPLIWDNTPVNDYPPTEGRVLLGPYVRREAGLSAQVAGILLNPMNQAAASKVALVGAAAFTWNDAAYDPARAHRAAAALLAGDPADTETIDALLAFFDTQNLAPTSATSGQLSQPQAPALASHLDAFRSRWSSGDRAGAVAALRPYAEVLAGAPARIREQAEPAFVGDAGPWLDALDSWGAALVTTLDALDARAGGDEATAGAKLAAADGLVAQAAAVHTIEGETRPQGPVRVADGVLDTFLADAKSMS